MKRSTNFFRAIACAAVLSIPAYALAADEVTPANGVGSKALLFTFGGLSTMSAGSFNGGIGGRYYLTDPIALRAGLQFALANQSLPATTGDEGSQSGSRFGLLAGAEYHFTKNRLSPYAGGALSFSTASTQLKNPSTVTGTAPTQVKTQTTIKNSSAGETIGGAAFAGGTTFGINGLLGAEYFITKDISLGAEYQLAYLMTSRSDQVSTTTITTTTATTSTTTSNSTTVKAGTLNTIAIASTGLLTLSFYF